MKSNSSLASLHVLAIFRTFELILDDVFRASTCFQPQRVKGSLGSRLGHPLSEHSTGIKPVSGKPVLQVKFGVDIPIFPFPPPPHSGPFQAGRCRGIGYGRGKKDIPLGKPNSTTSQLCDLVQVSYLL